MRNAAEFGLMSCKIQVTHIIRAERMIWRSAKPQEHCPNSACSLSCRSLGHEGPPDISRRGPGFGWHHAEQQPCLDTADAGGPTEGGTLSRTRGSCSTTELDCSEAIRYPYAWVTKRVAFVWFPFRDCGLGLANSRP